MAGRTDELLDFGLDNTIETQLRVEIGREMSRVGRVEDAVEVLRRIAEDKAENHSDRDSAVMILGEMGRADIVGPILLEFLDTHARTGLEQMRYAAQMARFNCTEELQLVARDRQLIGKSHVYGPRLQWRVTTWEP